MNISYNFLYIFGLYRVDIIDYIIRDTAVNSSKWEFQWQESLPKIRHIANSALLIPIFESDSRVDLQFKESSLGIFQFNLVQLFN